MDSTALQKVIADLYRHIALLQETVQQMERHSIADTEALLQRVRELEGQL
jgi:23S rRNA G2069 N7-methylase RlmK/C1962 C5-methylase RlmI